MISTSAQIVSLNAQMISPDAQVVLASAHAIYFFLAVITIETPNGKLKFLSQNLSALKILPKIPFKAETLTLFSDSGLIPVIFIKVLPARIGAKNVQFA